MPVLGADMDAGTIVEWRVKPGDTVHRGDIVAVVDTDKSTIEVEVFEDGVVDALLVEPGVEVDVGTPLAHLRALGRAEPAAGRTEPAVAVACDRRVRGTAGGLRPDRPLRRAGVRASIADGPSRRGPQRRRPRPDPGIGARRGGARGRPGGRSRHERGATAGDATAGTASRRHAARRGRPHGPIGSRDPPLLPGHHDRPARRVGVVGRPERRPCRDRTRAARSRAVPRRRPCRRRDSGDERHVDRRRLPPVGRGAPRRRDPRCAAVAWWRRPSPTPISSTSTR